MKAKKEIEEILKEKFDSFQPHVPESVWTNIQTGMGGSAGATSSGGIFSSVIGKIAAIIVGGGIIAGSVYVINNYQVTPRNSEQEVKSETTLISELDSDSKINADKEIPTSPRIESKVISVEKSKDWGEITVPKDVRIKTITKKDKDQKAPVYESVADMELSKSSRTILTLEDLDNLSTNNNPPKNLSTEDITVVVEEPEVDGSPFATIKTSVVGGNAPLEVSFDQYSSEGKIKWVFGDGAISSKEKPKHTYTEEGRYVVSLIIELPNGEIAMDEKVIEVAAAVVNSSNVEVAPSQITSQPNVFTPNGDGINDYMMVGAENMEVFHFILMDINNANVLFETNDPAFNWDGTLVDGTKIDKGTYIYIIRAKGKDGNVFDTSGALSVQ